MRWQHARRKQPKHAPPRDAVVVAVTTPLTLETAIELGRRVDRVSPDDDVVIDLTAIPGFDTDGADALLALQAGHTAGRVSIVGFRQAAARLVAPDEPAPTPAPPVPLAPHSAGSGWAARRLRNLVVIQAADTSVASAEGLEQIVADVVADADAAIIVLDLRGVAPLPATAVDAIAFASSTAALRGQELLVVNVCEESLDALRACGLSATTFVAPAPFGEPIDD